MASANEPKKVYKTPLFGEFASWLDTVKHRKSKKINK